jgi:uncharacterized protein
MSYRVLIAVAILFLIDLYVFQGVKVLIQSRTESTQRVISIIYWSFAVLCLSIILLGFITDFHTWPKTIRTYSFALVVIHYFSKIFVVVFLLLDDTLRLFRWIYEFVHQHFFSNGVKQPRETIRVSRIKFFSQLGFIIGSVPFIALIYGMIGSAFDFRVRKVRLKFANLPDAFNGLKIAQVSDIHSGSYVGTGHLQKAVDLLMEQKADIIFFTGDLVNDTATEVDEFVPEFKQIQAPLGVYSILGNHDYGDYKTWNSPEEKAENLERLKTFQKDFGWKLMLNEHTYIKKGNDEIALIGIEYLSGNHRFAHQAHGNMKQATANLKEVPFKILLSHDPSHWNAEVTTKYTDIDLTLAGHTHGAQFGVEIPGLRWSPAQYFYKQWAGLYNQGRQYIYVNRGLGFIGYPGRVGILPEITVIELYKA